MRGFIEGTPIDGIVVVEVDVDVVEVLVVVLAMTSMLPIMATVLAQTDEESKAMKNRAKAYLILFLIFFSRSEV